ncbi:MAG: glycosyltransferase [Acidimicrobiia bacterium]
MTKPVTIAVVAYNDGAVLEACIESLRSVSDAPIVIVDNASDDDTLGIGRHLAAALPAISVVSAERNGGYAYGANLARTHIDTPYLAVMNADCVATGDWLSPCIAALDADPGIGGCSPTVGLAGAAQLNAEGLSIHKTGFGFNRHLGHPLTSAARTPSETPGIQGTAFVVRTEALDRIGGWYEGGFLYHEDVELSWALRSVGSTTWHVPTAPILHDYTLIMSAEKFFLLERNRIEMLSTYLHPATLVLLGPALLMSEAAVWAYALLARGGLPGAKARSYGSFRERREQRRERRAQVRAFRSVPDRELLASMEWRYPGRQLRTLRRGRPMQGRRGDRPMPTD